ncbi:MULTISPECIES: exodeoxyribonuclease VII large subunit [Sutcliffiella]|uniref:exodeoxyribonuclease VII large subunit n=1 Tax=Sutcliffiella TaxID=2837511 RepID=UPI0022DD72DE|nr:MULTISPECIES: exodeoxyribonuclease VII large subunit [Sutcliffiella]MED4017082.1 exodeoxyribonuclease VII large subunit [Sutcliffiella cohnii]WBL13683.1 exodeoxyribonuclease VII large subunit [Sutcliffiella sp. NC1]
MSEQKYLTVTALTKYIKRKFDVDPHLQDVLVKGEISNYKQHSRGHMYFTLKDENARLQAVMFAGNNRNLPFKPEEGMKVLVRGEITVYEGSGQYQIYIKEMQPDGIGSLYLAYEQLKKKLSEEGLFDAKYKKAIPPFPEKIGVITSPTGAAVRDIITTIKRRYPISQIIVVPALVQGGNAAPSIVQAIKQANELNMDVLIVGRGGGSIEELWAFNEEIVAREIFGSKTPIISAVGHETDFTIADWVADLRAPTPTAAAELAVPHIKDLMDKLLDRKTRLHRASYHILSQRKEQLSSIQKSYAFRNPKQLYVQKEQQLDRMMELLDYNIKRTIERKRNEWERRHELIRRHHPKKQVSDGENLVASQTKLLQKAMLQVLQKKKWEFDKRLSQIDALSPLKIMNRGYSIAYNENNDVIKRVEQTKIGDQMSIHVQNGFINCEVKSVKEEQKDE